MKKCLIILVIFLIGLTNCSKTNYYINGIQLYDISNEPSGLSGELTAGVCSFLGNNELIFDNCFIKNGKLFISLPDIVDDIYLDDHPLGGKMSRLEIRVNSNSFINLALKKDDKIEANEIAIIYYNLNASLSYPSLWDGITREIQFKKGWNIVNWFTCEVIDNLEALYANGYRWYIINN